VKRRRVTSDSIGYDFLMEPNVTWTVDSINLSDLEFWRRPWAEREAAFKTLRRESPITHYDQPLIEGTAIEFPRATVSTRHEVSRRADCVTPPRDLPLGTRCGVRDDLPSEMVEYFSGMISTDDPKHARLRRIVSNAFNPRNIRAVEDSIERKADEIIERARLSGTGDFITTSQRVSSRDHLRHDGRTFE